MWTESLLRSVIETRDPNRLDDFYKEVCRLHKTYYPDQRFGQFVTNFMEFLVVRKHNDPFFPEDDIMLTYLKEYCGEEV